MLNPWLQFALSALVVILSGSRLTRNAAVVARNTKIGTACAGALMLPLATSLPELVTTLRAVAIDAPDLALGNLLGSCLYNLSLLAVIDMLEGRGPLTARVSGGHILTASLSIITVCLVSIGIYRVGITPIGWVGAETAAIAVVYIIGGKLLFNFERNKLSTDEQEHDDKVPGKSASTGRAVLQFLVAAGFIVAAGVLLTDAADRLAVQTGLGHTFAGTILLAVSTSLPETVTTVSAVRLGFLDMAVANVFGANLMNMFILFWADLFYSRAPLLQMVSDSHLVSAAVIILISAVVIFSLTYRRGKALGPIGYDALLVVALYLAAVFLIYRLGG